MFSVYYSKGMITWSGLGPFVKLLGYLYCLVMTKLNNPGNPGNEFESWVLLRLPKVPSLGKAANRATPPLVFGPKYYVF